ncbi:MAG: hypothetical protein QF473_30260, partial [Planctomycetota bacterium]|nr:hypothetical protein [Planctomycetota bacterium]
MSIHANRSLRNVSVFFALTLFTASAFGGSTSPEAQKFLKDLRKKLAGVETLTWRFQPNRNSKVEGYFSKKANALKIVERYRGNRSKSVTIFSSDGVSRLDPYSGYIAKGGQSPPYSFATRYWFALPLLHPELLSEHDVTLETTDGDHFLSIEFTSPKATISITFDGKTMGQKGMIIQPGYSSSRMEVIEYHKAGDFLFPKHIKRTTGVGSSGSDIKVESVQFNVELEEDAFSFNEKELLIYDASLKEEDIRQRLKGDLKPIDAASLHFTLGMLAGRTDQNKAEVEYRKSI